MVRFGSAANPYSARISRSGSPTTSGRICRPVAETRTLACGRPHRSAVSIVAKSNSSHTARSGFQSYSSGPTSGKRSLVARRAKFSRTSSSDCSASATLNGARPRGLAAGRCPSWWNENPAFSTSPRRDADVAHKTACPASTTAREIDSSGLRCPGPPIQVNRMRTAAHFQPRRATTRRVDLEKYSPPDLPVTARIRSSGIPVLDGAMGGQSRERSTRRRDVAPISVDRVGRAGRS